MSPQQHQSGRRFVWLAEEDLAAARRVLSILGSGDEIHDQGDGAPANVTRGEAATAAARERAQIALALRQRRIEMLGRRFSSERPFAMLLALYVIEKREPSVAVGRLGTLSHLGLATTLRWLEMLLKEGWLTRASSPEDRRKAEIRLSDKARERLDRLFGWEE